MSKLVSRKMLIANKISTLSKKYHLDIDTLLENLFPLRDNSSLKGKIDEIRINDIDDFRGLYLGVIVYAGYERKEYNVFIDPFNDTLEVSSNESLNYDVYSINNNNPIIKYRIIKDLDNDVSISKKYTTKGNKYLKDADDTYIYEYIFQNLRLNSLIQIMVNEKFNEEEFMTIMLNLGSGINDLENLQRTLHALVVPHGSILNDVDYFKVKKIEEKKQKVDFSSINMAKLQELKTNGISLKKLLINLFSLIDNDILKITVSNIRMRNSYIDILAITTNGNKEQKAYELVLEPEDNLLKIVTYNTSFEVLLEDIYQIENDFPRKIATSISTSKNEIKITKKYPNKEEKDDTFQKYEYHLESLDFAVRIIFKVKKEEAFDENKFLDAILNLEVIVSNLDELKNIIEIFKLDGYLPDIEIEYEEMEIIKEKVKSKKKKNN